MILWTDIGTRIQECVYNRRFSRGSKHIENKQENPQLKNDKIEKNPVY